ncbi:hypothetical protein L3X38_022987 [Prunus dulcis]|uniref:Uncharacterized protein n=1 Tax=Prunus dulcis TaxID=3755 RepID=A0AAD4Z5Q6_PRUDU|nr:hypothetical protein L3X38_022987 [Prunus dulcis]
MSQLASLSLKLHNKSLYSMSLVTAYRVVAFLCKPRHRSLSLSFDLLITVDDTCYVHALLLLLVQVPCVAVVGTSIVTPACYGANIVAHVFAGVFPLWSRPLTLPLLLTFFALPIIVLTRFLCSTLSAAVLTGFLCSALPVAVLTGFLCSALSAAVLTGFLCSALSAAVLTGFLCSALPIAVLTGFLCSTLSAAVLTGFVFCLTYCRAHRAFVFCLKSAAMLTGFLCSALLTVVLTGFLYSALSAAMLTRFLCSALPIAVLTGFLCSALPIAVLTGFLCSALQPCSQGFSVLLCALFFRICSCVFATNFALVFHLFHSFHSWLTKRSSLQLVLLKYGVL